MEKESASLPPVPSEKVEYAALLLSQGKSREEVRSILAERWADEIMADRVMMRMNGNYNTPEQEDSLQDMRVGGLILLITIALPLIVFMMSGGKYIAGSFLLVIYGLYRFFKGFSRYRRRGEN